MEQLSFFEKLGVLFQNILAHPIFICVLLSPVLIIFLNKKIKKKAIVFIYIAILAIVLYVGNITIFSLFDNLMDNIFMTLYFPNFITLFLVELLSAIICLVTFLKKDITKSKKIINIVAFAIIQTLFILILTIIQANNIDIYKENALYASDDVLTLMQLLMGTFALQIITLAVIWAIDKVTAKLDGPKEEGIRPLEGRITHATLEGAKVINKKPEVIIQMPTNEPLDMSLIENTIIHPLDLNEEIIKEKASPLKKDVKEKLIIPPKPKTLIKYVTPEVKIDPLKPQGPLDKNLILNTHITPKDINEEIKEEKRKLKEVKISDALSKKAEDFGKERMVFTVPTPTKQEPLDKTLISQEKINPLDLNEAIIDEKMQVLTNQKTAKETSNNKKQSNKKYNKPFASIKQKLKPNKDVKKPTILKPIEEENAVFAVNDKSSPLRYVEAAKETLSVPKKDKTPTKFITKNEDNNSNNLKPDLMKPMEEKAPNKITDVKPEYIETKNKEPEKELIANLEIVDYDKMVKAIKNLKIIYTL